MLEIAAGSKLASALVILKADFTATWSPLSRCGRIAGYAAGEALTVSATHHHLFF